MRKDLRKLNGKRLAFTATVERFGKRSGYKGELDTILLVGVKLEGENNVITDHLWFTRGKSWDECKEGSVVRFEARISSYVKGYKGHDFMRQLENPQTKDYRLERPTKVKVLVQGAA